MTDSSQTSSAISSPSPEAGEASDAPRLVDGSPPATPHDLFARLESLGIETTTKEHPPLFTVEESKALRGSLSGGHTKNLFLRNKKGAMWLVVCKEDRTVDLKALEGRLGSGRLSFGRPERLMQYLGVIPGSVTPFAAINDTGGAVRVMLDSALLDFEILNVHPLDNRMTTRIRPADLLRFLEAVNHPPQIIAFQD